MLVIAAVIIAVAALLAWEIARQWRRRGNNARRRNRQRSRVAHQKAWDVVFGRRTRRRLAHQPTVVEDSEPPG